MFDPAVVSYGELLRVFWEHHDPTQGMRQGNDHGTQYRSVIHVLAPTQRAGRRGVTRRLPGRPREGRLRDDHDRDRRRLAVLLRRGVPPAVPRQESERLLPGPCDGQSCPGGARGRHRRRIDSYRGARGVLRWSSARPDGVLPGSRSPWAARTGRTFARRGARSPSRRRRGLRLPLAARPVPRQAGGRGRPVVRSGAPRPFAALQGGRVSITAHRPRGEAPPTSARLLDSQLGQWKDRSWLTRRAVGGRRCRSPAIRNRFLPPA